MLVKLCDEFWCICDFFDVLFIKLCWGILLLYDVGVCDWMVENSSFIIVYEERLVCRKWFYKKKKRGRD